MEIQDVFKAMYGGRQRVYVTGQEAAVLDMYGVRRFPNGAGEIEVTEAEAIELIDRAARLSVNAPKRLKKHFRCFVGSMAMSFGPEFYGKYWKEI